MIRRIILLGNAALVLVFGVLHAAGARASVGFLSGTLPGDAFELAVGIAYALAWFALVLWVPITTLAVILDAACGRLVRWRNSRRP